MHDYALHKSTFTLLYFTWLSLSQVSQGVAQSTTNSATQQTPRLDAVYTFCLVSIAGCPPSTVGDRALLVAAPRVWNGLPQHVTSAPSLAVFRSRLEKIHKITKKKLKKLKQHTKQERIQKKT